MIDTVLGHQGNVSFL